MAEYTSTQRERIQKKISEIQSRYGKDLADLLEEINRARLGGKAQVAPVPQIDQNTLRWSLKWKTEDKVTFELVIAVGIEDDGRAAKIRGVWVHRRAAAPIEYAGHTPTTRMIRLGTLISIAAIREATESQWR